MEQTLGAGLRLNSNKLRYDLINPHGQEGLVRVLTKGSLKYADHNWELGMQWSKVIASLKRHLAAFERGEDYDFDPNCENCQKKDCVIHTGELHIDHLQTNAHFLSTYYRTFPQGDDRWALRSPKAKIGLDVDDVCVNWVETWCNLHNIAVPDSWYFQWDLVERFDKMNADNSLAEFYSKLTPKEDPKTWPFEPMVYISHRPVSDEVTKIWLEKNNFPLKPVHHVKNREDKINLAKELNLDIFVDDNYDTYKAMNDAGICCYLMDAVHNRRYDVGYRRIKSLSELKNLV